VIRKSSFRDRLPQDHVFLGVPLIALTRLRIVHIDDTHVPYDVDEARFTDDSLHEE